jgi:hypothetical protein
MRILKKIRDPELAQIDPDNYTPAQAAAEKDMERSGMVDRWRDQADHLCGAPKSFTVGNVCSQERWDSIFGKRRTA